MSYDLDSYRNTLKHWLFQSLWNRAVSYDSNREEGFAGWNEVSIPLEQGSVLRQEIGKNTGELGCFNPFGTGQCLTTIRQITHTNKKSLFQSLWNRAVSYDKTSQAIAKSLTRFQSLWNRAVSYDEWCLLITAVVTVVSIPLEQGSVLRLQWGHQALCDKACRSHFPTFSETQRVGS